MGSRWLSYVAQTICLRSGSRVSSWTAGFLVHTIHGMKARVGILVVLVCLFSGCVAIPPLINVQHSEPKDTTDALKMRVEQLERRVSELETKQERR